MKVSEFKAATRIWSLASIDSGVGGLTFGPSSVYFQGMHIGAIYEAPEPLIADVKTPVSINGSLLSRTMALLNDSEELTLKLKGSSVVLRTASQEAKLSSSKGSGFIHESTEFGEPVRVAAAELYSAAKFAEAVASKEMSRPHLTGAYLRRNDKGRVVVQATDGIGCACITSIASSGDTTEFEALLSASDLVSALTCISDVDMTIARAKGLVCLADGRTRIVMSALQGEFPKLSSLPTEFEKQVQFPTAAFELIARAADTFNSNRLGTIRFKDGHVSVYVRGEELGTFEAQVGDSADIDDCELTFNTALLGATVHLGAEATLKFNNDRSPAMAINGGRYLWLSPVQPEA